MEAVDVLLKGWVERLQGLRRIHWGTPSEEPTKLEEWLYVGGNLANLGPGAWAKWFEEHPEVTHVVNCACKDVKYSLKDSVSVLNLPALDEEGFDLFSFWPKVKDYTLEAPGVLFHCQAGVNRSATLALAIWCVREQRPLLQVLGQGLQKRPGMLQNRSFQRQLIQCVHREGVLGSQEDVDAWHAEMDGYQKQVHRVFELFASDGVANFDLFQKVMQSVKENAEDQWRRMMMYRPLVPVAGGQLSDTVDEATVEKWLQASTEIFRKLLDLVAG